MCFVGGLEMNEESSLKVNEEEKIKITAYHTLNSMQSEKFNNSSRIFGLRVGNIKDISYSKLLKLINNLYTMCRLHYISLENRKIKKLLPEGRHPIQPDRGEIYNAIITENVGSEINDNHLVVVISNEKTNVFAEKINVVPIEGDGNDVPSYLVKLENADLEFGNLNKDPSRVIIPEILTIDKSRLDLKVGKINEKKMLEISRKIMKQLDIKLKDICVDNKK